MSVCFCNDDGSLRYEDLDGITEEQDGAASGGGFLQIEQVSISTTHRRKDLGVRCVKRLLEWLNDRDARQCQEHKQAFEAARPPPGDVEAMLTWLESEESLYKTLRAGWSLAVLQPGLENTEEDRGRWHEEHRRKMEGEEPSAADQAREAERMAVRKVARRNVTQQWARLGFRQACFASNFWYVIPSRLGLKTKEEVSDLLITETPERQPVAETDKQLISYLRGAKDVPLASFEADMRRLVASGANLNRCHVLIRAVMNGVTSEAKLRLLVRMGANPNDADEFAQTALHATAELIGGDKSTREGAVVAANTLVGVGASSSVKDVHGNTPLESVLKQIRHHADFDGALGLHWQPGLTMRKRYMSSCLPSLTPPSVLRSSAGCSHHAKTIDCDSSLRPMTIHRVKCRSSRITPRCHLKTWTGRFRCGRTFQRAFEVKRCTRASCTAGSRLWTRSNMFIAYRQEPATQLYCPRSRPSRVSLRIGAVMTTVTVSSSFVMAARSSSPLMVSSMPPRIRMNSSIS